MNQAGFERKPDAFIDDIRIDGMLHVFIIRSRIRHGSVKSIRLPELPEGFLLIGPDELPGNRHISVFGERHPILSPDEIDYAGQALYLLAGPNERMLQSLAEQIEIQYERKDPIRFEKPFNENELFATRTASFGEYSPLKAGQTIEGVYSTEAVRQLSSEPHGALAIPTETGMLVYCTTRWLYHVRSSMSKVLDLPADSIVVRTPQMSQTAEGRTWTPSLTAVFAGLVALRSGNPARLILAREASMGILPRQQPVVVRHTSGIDGEGELDTLRVEITADAGAFQILGKESLSRLCHSAVGTYSCNLSEVEARLVKSNSPPPEILPGFGIAPSTFALELHVSKLAETAQKDPYLWRREHLPKADKSAVEDTSSFKTWLRNDLSVALLDAVAKESDFQRKYAAYEIMRKQKNRNRTPGDAIRGIGLAISFQGADFVEADGSHLGAVSAKLDEQGKLYLHTTSIPKAGSSEAVWRKTATSILGLGEDAVVLIPPDSSSAPDTGPSVLSRNIVITRRLLQQCCTALQKRRFRSPLPLETHRSNRRSRSKNNVFSSISWAATVVEVEIDPVTLECSLRGVWMSVDPGMVFDEPALRRCIEIEIASTFDWCNAYESSWERSMILSSGMVGEETRSAPPITLLLLATPRDLPGPVEGLAMGGFPPAYVSAVSQATGFQFDSLPLTNQQIQQYAAI